MKIFFNRFLRVLRPQQDRRLDLDVTERYNSYRCLRKEDIESEIFFHNNIKLICRSFIQRDIKKESSFDYISVSGIYIKREILIEIYFATNNKKDKDYLEYLLIKHYKRYNTCPQNIIRAK